MAINIIDRDALDTALTAEADAIRRKTGGSRQIDFDLVNNKGFADAIDAIPTGGVPPILITKNIVQNGTYNASSDSADGYDQVTVAIPSYDGSMI